MAVKIPKRLIVGYRKFDKDSNQAFITEIRLSNRTKNSPFKIEKEKQWLNKLSKDSVKIKVNNEFRDGFSIHKTKETHFYSKRDRTDFYINHEVFNGQIQLTSENMINLINTCTFIKGEIKEKLIYDGTNFISQETLDELNGVSNTKDQELIDIRKELKTRKVLAKDLVPGNVYQTPITKDKITPTFMIYLGTVDDNNGITHHITQVLYYYLRSETLKEGDTYSANVRNNKDWRSGRTQQLMIPNLIRGDVTNYKEGLSPQYEYKGYFIKASRYTTIRYRKTIPSHFTPKDNVMAFGENKIKDINLFKGYSEEDLNLLKFIMLNPINQSSITLPLQNLQTFKETE